MRFVVSCVLTLLCLGTPAAFAAAPEPTTEEQKTLYALGLAINQSLNNFNLNESEFEIVKSGITDGFSKRPKLDLQKFGLKISEMQQARASVIAEAEKKVGAAFLAKAATEPGAKKTESGAILITTKEGNGATPGIADMVKVHYLGTLVDGTVFDGLAKQGGNPATLRVSEMSKCWVEGIQQIKVGGKSKLVCPSNLAYRDKGLPPLIKPGATLVFEIDLLEIVAKQTPQ